MTRSSEQGDAEFRRRQGRKRKRKPQAKPPVKPADKVAAAPLPSTQPPPPPPVTDSLWRNLRWAWVNTPSDIGPDMITALGYQAAIVWTGVPLYSWVATARAQGMKVAGWHRCTDPSPAQDGRWAAEFVHQYGLDGYNLNIEAEYDTHGKYGTPEAERILAMTGQLVSAFREGCPQVPLSASVTPRWTGDHDALRRARCAIWPEAYPGEIPTATLAACVAHTDAYGWHRDDVRPLVQVYPTNGVRPPVQPYLDEARAAGVKVTPYPIESCLDDEPMLRALVAVA